ncbi:hypothetical protein ACB092_12G133700 [Castanea dentata]
MMEREREGERNGPPLGADISILPEGCISDIFSLTSPKDACTACAVSPIFRAAAESNAVWERFLPSDYQAIIARSSSSLESLNLCSKKQIYLSLSDNPILIDDSKKSFFLDKSSGKKCYLLSARELSIVWGNTPTYWRWISLPEAEAEASRFPEVAELNYVWFFDISCKMSTSILSPETHYATYLVYKLRNTASGFGGRPFRASVETIGGGEVHEQTVHLGLFVMRNDGWLEIELGQFFNEGGEDDELQVKLMELSNFHQKTGLIVEGIEIRPTRGAGQDQ